MDAGGQVGGSLGLIELLDSHGDELLADFRRFYQLDLLDLRRGLLSPVLVLALIRHLPLDSAYVSALRGTEYTGWDRNTYVMADLYDAIRELAYLYVSSHAENPKKVKPFPPYPRPGVQVAAKPAKPTPLLARLRGEDAPAHVLGPGSKVPPPAPRIGR
ncbi:hypothetical protein [Acrocarpospora sp. B8E8]|uniref:hypothetical protein n=1 Tax=Acrocarpospora sp. B8E8 TaxID=3153572 RepID=UPI00325CDB6D